MQPYAQTGADVPHSGPLCDYGDSGHAGGHRGALRQLRRRQARIDRLGLGHRGAVAPWGRLPDLRWSRGIVAAYAGGRCLRHGERGVERVSRRDRCALPGGPRREAYRGQALAPVPMGAEQVGLLRHEPHSHQVHDAPARASAQQRGAAPYGGCNSRRGAALRPSSGRTGGTVETTRNQPEGRRG